MGAINSKLRRCGGKDCLFVFCAPAQFIFGRMREPRVVARAHLVRRSAV